MVDGSWWIGSIQLPVIQYGIIISGRRNNNHTHVLNVVATKIGFCRTLWLETNKIVSFNFMQACHVFEHKKQISMVEPIVLAPGGTKV